MATLTAGLAPASLAADLPGLVRRAERPLRLRAFLLAFPALLFLLLSFVLPIGTLLQKAGANPEVADVLPGTLERLQGWDGASVPGEPVFAALAADLRRAQDQKTAAALGKRLNYELPGMRSRVLQAARIVAANPIGPYRELLVQKDPVWGDVATWQVIARNRTPLTGYYLLTALDLRQLPDGAVARVEPDQAIFLGILGRTLWIAFLVTAATVVLGYPVAYLIAIAPRRLSQLMFLVVLLPLWTSLLVRTTAWVVLLQSGGVVNDLLLSLSLIEERLQLIFSRTGTVVAMAHIQLPFTILPILSVMRGIPGAQLRAARSLGAPPLSAYWRVYVPQTLPGVGAGALITFILSLGYYITPALVGGPGDQMVSNFISLYINRELNWGLASALGVVLLVVTLVLYRLYLKLVGSERLGLG
jgi:putative spermidine/putrescine transport system permease protein